MPNGELPDNAINRAALELLDEWKEQQRKAHFHTGKLGLRMKNLAAALIEEKDRPELVKAPTDEETRRVLES